MISSSQSLKHTNDRTTSFRKCPSMCILFHIIIQCLHTVTALKKMPFLYPLYVVPKSFTLTWRTAGRDSMRNATYRAVVGVMQVCRSEGNEVLKSSEAHRTLALVS